MGYEGELWFGNPSQKMNVLFDTGSACAWLYSEDCKSGSCPDKNQKYFQSKSQEFNETGHKTQNLAYGRGEIKGHPASDRTCFSSDEKHCVHNLNFLTVFHSEDLGMLKGSGLIGLSPNDHQADEIKMSN